ncbi:TrbG/VirB9 family P-type conjugative transfer protein [Burkholderia gladioli]|uniref:TrbG/VirB9 family P-type conjugative transfer protein n=1 Tax=Burkholderia gladioli TaxID=28095 RepID=UPI00163F7F7E|nr:TrbG/VirB9 family P-type conjugative transfer protein [Burkholderia gladioli]MDN7465804.1 TrbG/VirB9 family P-type conjugative transfer protein [Burkholderia gladioli]
MRCWTRSAALVATALAMTAAKAEITPGPCSDDAHIRCATYDRNETYRLPYEAGKAALLMLEPDESLQAIGMGDTEAWKVGTKGGGVFLKPKASQAQTNFLVLTSKRRYVIDLVPASKGEASTWSLSFDYPDERAAKAAAVAAKADTAREALARARMAGAATDSTTVVNTDYDIRGDEALAPTAIWDDGRFTYFQYATNRDLPEFYRVMADGSEALVKASTMQNDVKVIQDTAQYFVLRLGRAVLGIRNNGYSPDGPLTPAGTSVPGAVRLLKNKTEVKGG